MGSTAQLESSPCSLQLEKATHSYEDPAQPKYKQINYLNIHNIHVKKHTGQKVKPLDLSLGTKLHLGSPCI